MLVNNRRTHELTPIPGAFTEQIAIDVATSSIYIEKRLVGDPLLMSWLHRNERNGCKVTIVPTTLDDIVKLRGKGMRVQQNEDISLEVKQRAVDLIRTASKYKASDIHLIMRGTHADVQLVVDGKMYALETFTQQIGEALALAFYQGLATTKDASFNPLEFQNAQIAGDSLPLDIGVSSLRIVRGPCEPSGTGSFMTLRLQFGRNHKRYEMPSLSYPGGASGKFELGNMGYSDAQLEKLRRLMSAPSGIVIFTGPTGSGKSTALFECVSEISRMKPYRRLVTAEDPVEFPMEWAVQMVVTNANGSDETGDAFSNIARTMLRMAPEIIQISELRDADVIITAMEMAMTGHQVWTTAHVEDPFSFVNRFELKDATRLHRKVICDHKLIRGVVAQRLLPELCPHCSVSLDENNTTIPRWTIAALKTWGDISKVKLQSKTGCNQCSGKGTSGRKSVAEIVITTAALMNDFVEHGTEVARRNYRALPGSDLPMMDQAMKFLFAGQVDVVAIEDKIDEIKAKDQQYE